MTPKNENLDKTAFLLYSQSITILKNFTEVLHRMIK